MFAREFFLEFSDNFLLDFLPGLDLRLRNDDGDSLAARANVEFLGALKNECLQEYRRRTQVQPGS